MNEETDHRDENIGQMLKRLRGDTSLRGVQRLSGISNAYLSQIEKGERHPGPKLLRRLAALYGVGVHELIRKAGYLDSGGEEEEEPEVDETAEVERAYQYVLADPVFRVGTRPRGPLSIESKAIHSRAVRAVQRKEAPVVNELTLDDFCHHLISGGAPDVRLHPTAIAREFIDFFGLSAFPDMAEVETLLERADIATVVRSRDTRGLRGYHTGTKDGGYIIVIDDSEWDGAQEYTTLHEGYTRSSGSGSATSIPGSEPLRAGASAGQADGFAAAALMQPCWFSLFAEASGFDVVALQGTYGRALLVPDHQAGRGDAPPAASRGPVRARGEGRPARVGPRCGPHCLEN